MKPSQLVQAISPPLPKDIAEGLVSSYVETRQDLTTGTLGRVAPGKFVEKLVQALQFLETGAFDNSPSVDSYLRKIESRQSSLDDGLRLLASRIGRSMYGLRSKRNIAHIGPIDPNLYDLRYLFEGARWVMAELIRVLTTLPMDEAGALVGQIGAPVDEFLETFDEKRLVLADTSVRNELLIILKSIYPDARKKGELVRDLDRRNARSVGKRIGELWQDKLIEEVKEGFKLTRAGYREAQTLIRKLAAQK